MIPKSVQKSLRKSVEDIQPDPDDPDDGINPFLELEMDTENGGEDLDHPPEMTEFLGQHGDELDNSRAPDEDILENSFYKFSEKTYTPITSQKKLETQELDFTVEEHIELLCNAYQGPPGSRSNLTTSKFLLHGFPMITETNDKTIIQQQKQIQIDELINLQAWTKLPWDADAIHKNLSSPDMKVFQDKETKTCSMIISLRKPYKLPCLLAPVAKTWPQFLHLRNGRLDPHGNKIQFKHDLYLQPIPNNIENINSAGVLLCAIRGLILDRSGAVAEALINLIKQYIEGTTKVNPKTLTYFTMPYTTTRTQRFSDKRTGQSKSQKVIYPELLLLIYVSDYHHINELWNTLGLPEILSHRTLILPAWRVIIGRTEQVVLAARTNSLDVTHTVTKIRNLLPEFDPEAVLRLLTNEGPNRLFFLKIGMIAVERGRMQSPPTNTDTLLLLSDEGAIGILLTPIHQQCLAISAGASSRLITWSGPLEGSEHQRKIWQIRSKEPDRKKAQTRQTQEQEWKTVGARKANTVKTKPPQGTHFKDVQPPPPSKTSLAWGRLPETEITPLLEGYSLQLKQRKNNPTGPPPSTTDNPFQEWSQANPGLAAQLQSLSPAQRVQLQEAHYRSNQTPKTIPSAAPPQPTLASRLEGYLIRLFHTREVEARKLTHDTSMEWQRWQQLHPAEARLFEHASVDILQRYDQLVVPIFNTLSALSGPRNYKRKLWKGLILRAIRDHQPKGEQTRDFEEWTTHNPAAAKVLAPSDSTLPPPATAEEAESRRIDAQVAFQDYIDSLRDRVHSSIPPTSVDDPFLTTLSGFLLHQQRLFEQEEDAILHTTEMKWRAWAKANPNLLYLFDDEPQHPAREAIKRETLNTCEAQAEEASYYLAALSDYCDDTMLPIITKGILLRAISHHQEMRQADPPLCDPTSLRQWERLYPEAAAALAPLGTYNVATNIDMDAEEYEQGATQHAITALRLWRQNRLSCTSQPLPMDTDKTLAAPSPPLP